MDNKALAEKQLEDTLSTLKQLDDNVWIMQYKSNYGLDKLLEKGCSNIMDAVRFLQKETTTACLVPRVVQITSLFPLSLR